MYLKSTPPKAIPRFHGPFIIVKKLDTGAVTIRLQDGSEEIVHLDRCRAFNGQPMIEWTEDFVRSDKKDMSKSTALRPATRIKVADDDNQIFQIGSILDEPEDPQSIRMEEEEGDISLLSDTITKDTEMSEPPSNQDDFFV
jgi:hypothetical protein